QRRAARQQLPAVADRLRRNLGHRDALARLPPPPPARCHRRLSEARTPLRRHRRTCGSSLRPVLVRVISALVMLPLLLAVLLLLPPWATLALALLAVAGSVWEYAALSAA